VRIGIVGAGWWAGEVHAPAFAVLGAKIEGVYAVRKSPGGCSGRGVRCAGVRGLRNSLARRGRRV
jgi:predicted dehydrogenase